MVQINIREWKKGEIYNGGWGKSYSIKEVGEMTKAILGWTGSVYWNLVPRRPGEIPKIELDFSKSKRELGWEPSVVLKEGLELLISYWQKSHDKFNRSKSKT
ncbi:MAG: hypothetical protein QME61_00900 [Patescibacteria group bacterium]|nr:hypothetical protein [Patescibacteria group bacterium]